MLIIEEKKMAEKLFPTNLTEFTRRNSDVDVIAGCLDYKRQKPVAIGDYYHTDDCTICLCSTTERMCKQIYCAPPTNCDGFIKKDPLHCCDVCAPPGVIERQPDETSLNMKLGALTVTLFLIVSLILFTFHRLRRKRVLITLRRLRALRRQETSYSCSFGHDVADSVGTLTVINGVNIRSNPSTMGRAVRLNGYQFSEAPPSYASAVTLPRPPVALHVIAASASSSQPTVFGEPPPPYASLTQISEHNSTTTSVARRSLLSSVVNALATIRRHRSSRSLPSNVATQSQIQQEHVAVAPTNHTRVGRELLWRHSSMTSDYHDYFTDDGSGGSTSLSASRDSLNSASTAASTSSCCCSQCDSGLSRDDLRSLSSNDVRPRSEMSMIRTRPSSIHADSILVSSEPAAAQNVTEEQQNAVANQRHQRLCESCQTALTTTSPQDSSAATASSSNSEYRNGDVPSSAAAENERRKLKKRNLCKRKLKKLISRRRKKKPTAEANVADAIASSSSRRPSRSDDGDTETNDTRGQSTSSRQNERMTSV